MPPQQISPSAARRSPWSRDPEPPPERVGDPLLVALGVTAPTPPELHAESIRTMPSGRTPSTRRRLAIRHRLADLRQERARPSPSSSAGPPPIGGQTGATDRADHQVRARVTPSASALSSSSLESMST